MIDENMMLISYDRKRGSDVTVDEEPGAHTGSTRQYIPGYADSNIVYWDDASGNDSWTGANPTNSPAGTGPKLSYSSAATAAGSTKKIRKVNSSTVSVNITKPTEATIGTSSSIIGSLTSPVNTFTQSGTLNSYSGKRHGIVWVPWLSKFICTGGSSKLYNTSDMDTFTAIAGHGFGSSTPECIAISQKHKLIFIAGGGGKVGISEDGSTFAVAPFPDISQTVCGIHYDDDTDILVLVGANGMIATSNDQGSTFSVQFMDLVPVFYGVAKSPDIWVVTTNADNVYTSVNGYQWALQSTGISAAWVTAFYSKVINKFLLGDEGGTIAYSTDGVTWTAAGTPSFGGDGVTGFSESIELSKIVAVGLNGKIAYSSDGNTFTQAGTPSYSTSDIWAVSYSPLLGKFLTGGSSKAAYSTEFSITMSAHIAGFSIQAVQYSGTLTAYNCTMRQPGTSAALTLDNCRVNYDSHISNDAAKSRASLYIGDRHTTCDPAAQNDIDMNLDTWGGKWYIYNASETGFERIRDCLGHGGIIASYPVTVSGRANVEGESVNVDFDADVTHNDPRFVDETDFQIEFQSNGYARNSLAAGRSNLYFNSAGDPRDLGAWSYVESNVNHYFSKNAIIPKGKVQIGVDFSLNEQQGDSGAVSVYGNTRRLKDVLTISWQTAEAETRAVFDALLRLTDKTVDIRLNPEWSENIGSVTVNGDQSGVEFLTVDSTTTYNGMTLTIGGDMYYVMRAAPTPTAATKLILDRTLETDVSDNEVIQTNYPSGNGIYQFAGVVQNREKLDARHLWAGRDYETNFVMRFVRQKT